MLDGLWFEVTNLFSRIYTLLDIRFIGNGQPLDGGMYGNIAVGIVGLLAVSVPFVVLIKVIKFVTGGYFQC